MKKKSMSKLDKGLLSVVGVGALGSLVFLIFGNCLKPYLDQDVFRSTYRFFLFAVLGGGLTYWLKELSLERQEQLKNLSEERQNRQEKLVREEERLAADERWLREIHEELHQAYNKAKKVRRVLRARGVAKDGTVVLAVYSSLMEELMDAQLVFETYAKRIIFTELWFSDAQDLEKALLKIEGYLNQISKEYQDHYKTMLAKKSTALKSLPGLYEFIGPRQNWKKFKTHFKKPIRKVFKLINQEWANKQEGDDASTVDRTDEDPGTVTSDSKTGSSQTGKPDALT